MALMSSWIGSVIMLTLRIALGPAARALQRAEPVEKRLQPLESPHELAPRARILERDARGVYARVRNGMADHRGAGDVHVVRDREVSADRDRPADLAAAADLGAARDAGA